MVTLRIKYDKRSSHLEILNRGYNMPSVTQAWLGISDMLRFEALFRHFKLPGLKKHVFKLQITAKEKKGFLLVNLRDYGSSSYDALTSPLRSVGLWSFCRPKMNKVLTKLKIQPMLGTPRDIKLYIRLSRRNLATVRG